VHRCSLARVALVALLAIAPARAAEDLAVEAHRRGDGVEITARAVVVADPRMVWQVLTDYEGLPRFVPGISRSRVHSREGQRLTLEQAGEARFLFFSFPIQVTLEVTEAAPESIASRAIGGNVRRMTGRYDIAPDAGGGVLLRYQGVVEPDFRLPPLIGAAALRANAEEQFTAMVAEIERRAAAK
jgi:ribosome-associated toxin RatA of RatAB toxin-antitoxin module